MVQSTHAIQSPLNQLANAAMAIGFKSILEAAMICVFHILYLMAKRLMSLINDLVTKWMMVQSMKEWQKFISVDTMSPMVRSLWHYRMDSRLMRVWNQSAQSVMNMDTFLDKTVRQRRVEPECTESYEHGYIFGQN